MEGMILTESKKFEIITKEFEGNHIDFIEKDKDIWITAEALGTGLEYATPRISIMKLYERHRDEIEDYSSVVNLTTDAGMRETTVFNEMGAYLLIMFSTQPKAKEFRKWVVNVIKEIRKKGYYIEESNDPYDTFIQQADLIKKAFIDLKEQNKKLILIENKVNGVNSELKSFEDKYEKEKPIRTQTIKKITDLVHKCVLSSGRHYSFFYQKIWDHFGIRSTKDTTEPIGQKIVEWIQSNDMFKRYLNREV